MRRLYERPRKPYIHEHHHHPDVGGHVDDNSCIEGSILGGIAGAGAGAALSRGDGRWCPLGIVGGSMVGCQVTVVEVSTFDTIHSDLLHIKRVKGKPLMQPVRIGIELKDGQFFRYHHWDGYPQWLVDLNTHYNSRQQVADLIDGGDMSSCGRMNVGVVLMSMVVK